MSIPTIQLMLANYALNASSAGCLIRMARFLFALIGATMLAVTGSVSIAQALPATPGETLSGKRIVLADVVHGHNTVLVAGFSRQAGPGSGDWVKAIHADPAFAGTEVYQVAMLADAPSLMRGMIRSGMKKGVSSADQDRFVVLTEDENSWKSYFDVTTKSELYVALIDPAGKTLWHGHGRAANLESQVRAALR
jgi:hypothetical protein